MAKLERPPRASRGEIEIGSSSTTAVEARMTESVSMTDVHCICGHVSEGGDGITTTKEQVALPLRGPRSVQEKAEAGVLAGPWRSITMLPEVAGALATVNRPVGLAGSYTNWSETILSSVFGGLILLWSATAVAVTVTVAGLGTVPGAV